MRATGSCASSMRRMEAFASAITVVLRQRVMSRSSTGGYCEKSGIKPKILRYNALGTAFVSDILELVFEYRFQLPTLSRRTGRL